MEINIDQVIDFFNSSNFNLIKIILLAYVGLLWLSIIIWIARDSISRSSSLLFQTISIFIGIFIPFLGVLIYLIIRPSKTTAELYYEELEHRLLTENTSDLPQTENTCEKCMTALGNDFLFCPSCGEQSKRTCQKCERHFSLFYSICPYCGMKQEEAVSPKKRPGRKKKVSKEEEPGEETSQEISTPTNEELSE